MRQTNFHTHTSRCHHAYGEDEEMVRAAIQNGFEVLGISDHTCWKYDYDFVAHMRMKLDEFAGKNIYIAFVYEGAPDGVTTSVQIDNVLVMRNESETIVNKEVDEYDYKENEWVFKRTVPSGLLFETITMQKEDFQLVVDYVAANFDEGYGYSESGSGRILLWRKFCLWQLECKRIYA